MFSLYFSSSSSLTLVEFPVAREEGGGAARTGRALTERQGGKDVKESKGEGCFSDLGKKGREGNGKGVKKSKKEGCFGDLRGEGKRVNQFRLG